MSFGAEMKDFLAGFEVGSNLVQKGKDRAWRQKMEEIRAGGFQSEAEMDAAHKIMEQGGTGGTGQPGNPRAPRGGGGVGEGVRGDAAKAAAKERWDYLVGLGVPPNLASGMVGNAYAESSFDSRLSTKGGDQGSAHGEFQWRGDRITNLLSYAKQHGLNPEDWHTQYQFAWHETQQLPTFKAMMAARDPTHAADLFALNFERPQGAETGDPNNIHNISGRRKLAQQFSYGMPLTNSKTIAAAWPKEAIPTRTAAVTTDDDADASAEPDADADDEDNQQFFAEGGSVYQPENVGMRVASQPVAAASDWQPRRVGSPSPTSTAVPVTGGAGDQFRAAIAKRKADQEAAAAAKAASAKPPDMTGYDAYLDNFNKAMAPVAGARAQHQIYAARGSSRNYESMPQYPGYQRKLGPQPLSYADYRNALQAGANPAEDILSRQHGAIPTVRTASPLNWGFASGGAVPDKDEEKRTRTPDAPAKRRQKDDPNVRKTKLGVVDPRDYRRLAPGAGPIREGTSALWRLEASLPTTAKGPAPVGSKPRLQRVNTSLPSHKQDVTREPAVAQPAHPRTPTPTSAYGINPGVNPDLGSNTTDYPTESADAPYQFGDSMRVVQDQEGKPVPQVSSVGDDYTVAPPLPQVTVTPDPTQQYAAGGPVRAVDYGTLDPGGAPIHEGTSALWRLDAQAQQRARQRLAERDRAYNAPPGSAAAKVKDVTPSKVSGKKKGKGKSQEAKRDTTAIPTPPSRPTDIDGPPPGTPGPGKPGEGPGLDLKAPPPAGRAPSVRPGENLPATYKPLFGPDVVQGRGEVPFDNRDKTAALDPNRDPALDTGPEALVRAQQVQPGPPGGMRSATEAAPQVPGVTSPPPYPRTPSYPQPYPPPPEPPTTAIPTMPDASALPARTDLSDTPIPPAYPAETEGPPVTDKGTMDIAPEPWIPQNVPEAAQGTLAQAWAAGRAMIGRGTEDIDGEAQKRFYALLQAARQAGTPNSVIEAYADNFGVPPPQRAKGFAAGGAVEDDEELTPANQRAAAAGQPIIPDDGGGNYRAATPQEEESAGRKLVPQEAIKESTKAGLKWINDVLLSPSPTRAIGEDPAAGDAQQKFDTNDHALTTQEFKELGAKVDPDNKLSQSEKTLKIQQDLFDFYMAHGNYEKAAAASAAVLMYGRRVSQTSGTMALAALENKDMVGAAKWMAKAYETLPDGKELRIDQQVSPQGTLAYEIVDLDTGQVTQSGEATMDDMVTMAKSMSSGMEWATQTYQVASSAGLAGGTSRSAGKGAATAGLKSEALNSLKEAGEAFRSDPSEENRQAYEDAETKAYESGVQQGSVTAFRKRYGIEAEKVTESERKRQDKAKADKERQDKVAGFDQEIAAAGDDPTKAGAAKTRKVNFLADEAFNEAKQSNKKRIVPIKQVEDAIMMPSDESGAMPEEDAAVIRAIAPDFLKANLLDGTGAVNLLRKFLDPNIALVPQEDGSIAVGDEAPAFLSSKMLTDLMKIRRARKAAG